MRDGSPAVGWWPCSRQTCQRRSPERSAGLLRGGAITHGEIRREGGAISRGHQHPSTPLLKCTDIAKLLRMFRRKSAERRRSMAINSVNNDSAIHLS
jgi:hypothetical protein